MRNPIIGRKIEIKQLRSYLISRKSEFVAVYGRRRVGKTFLIREVYKNDLTFQLTGLANVSLNQQLSQFHADLLKHNLDVNWDPKPASDWFVAFRQLSKLIEYSIKETKKVIFLDELPWLDTRKSKFLSALEHFWNSWASARNDIVLVVCGSAASWMLNHIINNKGGLHNRITGRIKLSPFTLKETELFLESRDAIYNRYQTLQLYMALGGIPYYLDLIDPGKSASQNINALFFSANAPLKQEYQNLYASLFNKHENHIKVIEALAKKGKGLSRIDLLKSTKLTNGGGMTRILKELEESNFIRRYKSFEKKQRESTYQLVDLYSLFYLRFIKNSDSDDENYWLNNIETPAIFSWGGYAFEIVCLHHTEQIKKALGISGVQTSISAWHSKNAQIDLVIDRRDQVINICEMKFSINNFVIDKKYSENLRNKLGYFKQITKTKKALFLTMITTYGIEQNQYAGMVRNSLTMDILFD